MSTNKVTHALQVARDRVRLVNMGRQYTVHTWSPRHNATWMGHLTDYWRARAMCRAGRIREALMILGEEPANADGIAVDDELDGGAGRWENVVRDYINGRTL